MAEAKREYVNTWLLDAALIIFAVTVLAYFLTYLCVINYARTLGIPWEFISLNPATLVAVLTLILPLGSTTSPGTSCLGAEVQRI